MIGFQKNNLIAIAIITIIGGLLRLYNLGLPPLWIDEALFVNYIVPEFRQEFIPAAIYWLFPTHSEFWIRFPFALAGTLTIPAIYFSLKNKKYAILGALLFATFPLFVYWSRLARPYGIAGLFVVLGWRYTWAYIPALLTTPVSILAINWVKIKKYWWILLIMLAIGLFLIRTDSDRNFLELLTKNNARFLYVPILAGILYLSEYGFPYLECSIARFRERKGGVVQRFTSNS